MFAFVILSNKTVEPANAVFSCEINTLIDYSHLSSVLSLMCNHLLLLQTLT